jgi:hypothetical protein
MFLPQNKSIKATRLLFHESTDSYAGKSIDGVRWQCCRSDDISSEIDGKRPKLPAAKMLSTGDSCEMLALMQKVESI